MSVTPIPAFPAIDTILPHRAPMLLLDRLVEAHTEGAVAEYTPLAYAWYSSDVGHMPAWIGIELMAQTVATHVGWLKAREGAPPRPGALLGTRSYRAHVPEFTAGRTLQVTARRVYLDEGGLGAYECAIAADGVPCAQALLKVYEPEDFGQFVSGARA